MKDYMEEQGLLELRTPRDTIKKAFEIEQTKKAITESVFENNRG